ncbi:hypothetical protein [Nonomuraea sp. NPDC049709]|uniref:hypothetical protein n=1 Tax=Nonomuraea sp. NPDC049709 TaxID=3154736 RepID=UPI00343D8ED3
MLLNAAHATAIVEARLPLAPAWGSGPPRSRSIFAQAREAGTDPADVRPGLDIGGPPIDAQIVADVEAARCDDPKPDAQCAGTTLKHQRCTKTIVTGIGSAHCAVHLTPAERQRRDILRAAQDRRMQALQDALEEQRVELAARWADRYGRRPDRLELPSPPVRPRKVAPLDGRPGLELDRDDQAMLAFHDSGWPMLCPRSAEIIDALLTCPHGTVAELAELASYRTPQRWACGEEWLESSIWDGIRPPDLVLPAPGAASDLDEQPAIQVLRRHLTDDHQAWERRLRHPGRGLRRPACGHHGRTAGLLARYRGPGLLRQRSRRPALGAAAAAALTVAGPVRPRPPRRAARPGQRA